MKSKSRTKFREAITTTNKLNPILINELLVISMMGIWPIPNMLINMLTTYKIPMPKVAATTPSLKFSVTLISLDLYAANSETNIPIVRTIA